MELPSTLPEHFEAYLGPIAGGLTTREGERFPFQVVLFEETPMLGVHALSTLGLSKIPLTVADESGCLHQELLIMYAADDGHANLPGVLQDLAMEAIERDLAFAIGNVIGPRGPLRDGATVEAFVVAWPVWLPDEFATCQIPSGPRVVIAWLVPITPAEAAFVRAHGWPAFSAELGKHDPDLHDFRRASIV